jgi:demethylmenaquinone methyltransferase / 2-methoxy-6-polyprenyl-1,4-benzoquinol methylase
MSSHATSDGGGLASSDQDAHGARHPGTPTPEAQLKRQARELFRGLPDRYDLLSARLSFGQDPRWRRALVDAVAPSPGERVLDVATGTGLVAAELARRGCAVVGLDQSAEMLSAARARFATRPSTEPSQVPRSGIAARRSAVQRRPAGRVELIEGEAEVLPFADASFDALTFTYLLRYVADPRATMGELARVVRPGARVASLEFGVPPRMPARAAWRLYTTICLPALGRMVSRDWEEVGRFLGPSIVGFYRRHPLEQIVEYWQQAGLQDVSVRRMSLGGGIIMSATRRVLPTTEPPRDGQRT